MKVVIASLNPALERLLIVDRLEVGRVHTLSRDETLAGGKGVNVARVLGQLGTPALAIDGIGGGRIEPVLVGPLGGPTGDLQRLLLDRERIDSIAIPIGGWTRVNEVLVDLASADSATVFNAVGPALTAEETARVDAAALAAIADAGAVVCTGSVPPGVGDDVYARWIAAGRAAGTLTLLDAKGPALQAGASAHPTIVKVNRDEVDDLAVQLGSTTSALVDSWLRGGTETVIVTDGDRPTLAVTPEWVFSVGTAAVPTVSAVGSGDAFTAGLLAARLSGDDWERALRVAAACGASNAASPLARLAETHPPADLLHLITITRTETATW